MITAIETEVAHRQEDVRRTLRAVREGQRSRGAGGRPTRTRHLRWSAVLRGAPARAGW